MPQLGTLDVSPLLAGAPTMSDLQTDGLLLDLSAMRGVVATDPVAGRATALPGTLIRDFYEPLWDVGLALRNQGDIDTQQIAGAVATGTHGSGTGYTSLSGVVRGVRLVTATGDVREVGEDDLDLLHAAQVSVGMLGVVTQLELEVTDVDEHHVDLYAVTDVDDPEAASWAATLRVRL